MQGTDQEEAERIFSKVLSHLSKLLIANNIPLSSAQEALKRALVEAASEAPETTDSVVALRSGVHRKDVKRLRAAIREGRVEKSPIRGVAAVMTAWANAPGYQDADGAPRVLTRSGTEKSPGFDALIRLSKVDLAPATVLQELVAQSLVRVDDGGRITLLSDTFVGQSGAAALKAFDATVTDHVGTAVDNVLSPPGAPRKFDQVLRYSHLSEASVAALEAEARKLARDYLEHMNAMAHRLQSEDDASGQLASGRFVSGVYVAPTYPGSEGETGRVTQSPKEGDRE